MDNEQNKFIGTLFESIGYTSIEDLRNLIDNLNNEQTILFINKSLDYCYNKGIFTLQEAELVSKCLSILNSKMFKTNFINDENTIEG